MAEQYSDTVPEPFQNCHCISLIWECYLPVEEEKAERAERERESGWEWSLKDGSLDQQPTYGLRGHHHIFKPVWQWILHWPQSSLCSFYLRLGTSMLVPRHSPSWAVACRAVLSSVPWCSCVGASSASTLWQWSTLGLELRAPNLHSSCDCWSSKQAHHQCPGAQDLQTWPLTCEKKSWPVFAHPFFLFPPPNCPLPSWNPPLPGTSKLICFLEERQSQGLGCGEGFRGVATQGHGAQKLAESLAMSTWVSETHCDPTLTTCSCGLRCAQDGGRDAEEVDSQDTEKTVVAVVAVVCANDDPFNTCHHLSGGQVHPGLSWNWKDLVVGLESWHWCHPRIRG